MNVPLIVCFITLIATTSTFAIEVFTSAGGTLTIPDRQDLKIDGDLSDWDAGTYSVIRLFADETGRRDSLDAAMKVAWSTSELLIGLSVKDDKIAEAPGFSLWQGDALVLHCSGGQRADQPILFMLTPGIGDGGKQVEPRTLVNDFRKDPEIKDIEFNPRYSTKPTASGYQMEIALPLNCFGLPEARVGDLLHLQVEVKDREDDVEKPDLQWNPGLNAIRNPSAFNKIRLGNQADHQPQFAAMGRIVDEEDSEVLLFGDPSLAGLSLDVHFPDLDPLSTTLSLDPGSAFAFAKVNAPFTGQDDEAWMVDVYRDQQMLAQLDFASVLWVDSTQQFAPIPSWASMMAFEKDRLANDYSKDAILAIGSSSIRIWDTIEKDLHPWSVIKRGFGGSSMSDVLGAYRYLVEPYDVSRFLIYEGDTESGRGMPEAFLRHARIFVERLAKDRPDATIVFLTPKPSPRRFELWKTTYKGLEALVAQYNNVHLIDVATPLFAANGTLREELFKSDGVHLNEAGYKVWTDVITPRLESIFGEPQ